MIKPLDQVLEYRNRNILYRFSMLYDLPEEEAFQIYEDMLRFLWLYATYDERRSKGEDVPDVLISGAMMIIDQMWHCFILYTEHYAQFCQLYFGRFIHHPPILYRFYKMVEAYDEEVATEKMVEEMITLTVNHFGEETAIRWFDTFDKYSKENMIH